MNVLSNMMRQKYDGIAIIKNEINEMVVFIDGNIILDFKRAVVKNCDYT